jgi:hypothetical protein
MLAFPLITFLCMDDAPGAGFLQAAETGAGAFAPKSKC